MARELSIEVTANTQQAETALGRVENAVQGVERAAPQASKGLDGMSDALGRTEKSAGGLANTFSALIQRAGGPLGIATAFITAGKKAMDFADAMGDLSKQTGIGVEALQKWEFLAKTNGKTLDALTQAAQRLGADLAQGDKSAVAGVRKLGLSVEDLLRMNPEDRFEAVAVAIGKIEDPAMRAAAAEDILKRRGVELTGIMKDMADGSAKWAPAIGADWIEAGDKMKSAFDTALAHAKNLAFYMVMAFPKSMMDGVKAWKDALASMGMIDTPLPTLPNAPNLPGAGAPKPFDPLGGRQMSDIENELTASAKKLISARTRTASATEEVAQHELMLKAATNTWLVGARGPNVSGAFPWTVSPFPGWAEQAPLPTTGWQPPMAGFPGAVPMNRPGAMGGGGSFWQSLMKNPFMGMGLGMLPGLLPGMSGQGSSIGGGLGGALGGMSGIAKMLGGFAGFLGPIGGIVGGLIGKLFGPSQRSQTDKARQGLMDQFGGFDGLAKMAGSVGFNLDAMFKADKVKDFEAEVKKLNAALEEHAQKIAKINSDFQPWLQSAVDLGIKLPDSLQRSLDKMVELGDLTGENADAVKALGEAGEFDIKKAEEAAGRLGISVDLLGPKFGKMKLQADVKSFINDFTFLTEVVGTDMGTALFNTKDKFSVFVQDAKRLGTTLPENMKPWIEELSRAGLLVDENGEKIDDLSGLKFADPIKTEMQKVIDKLQELIDKIGGIAGGFEAAKKAAGDYGDAVRGIPDVGHGDPAVTVSRGGIIMGPGRVQYFGNGGFVPRGTDTVPAMLTPGEMVLSRDMVKSLFNKISSGGGDEIKTMPPLVVVVQDSGEAVKVIQDNMGRWISGNIGDLRTTIDEVARSAAKRVANG